MSVRNLINSINTSKLQLSQQNQRLEKLEADLDNLVKLIHQDFAGSTVENMLSEILQQSSKDVKQSMLEIKQAPDDLDNIAMIL